VNQPRRPRICQACGNLVGSLDDACPTCGHVDSALEGALDSLIKRCDFTRLFLLLNVLLFVIVQVMMNRTGGSEIEMLAWLGLLIPPRVMQGEVYLLVTPIFLHIGFMHLLFNGFALFQIGPDVERAFGKERFVLIYMLAGILGNLGSCLVGVGGAGASGALFGLIGAHIAFGLRMGNAEVTRRSIGWAVTVFLICFLMGPRINHYAHFFGLLGGLGTAYALGFQPPSNLLQKRLLTFSSLTLALLVPVSFALAILRV